MRAQRIAGLLALVVACQPAPPPTVTNVALTGDVVARVGAVSLPASLVGTVAAARSISPQAAAQLLIDDAVAAEGARLARLDATPAVALQIEQSVARVAVARFREQALAAGPPTPTELAEITEARWREVDRPESIRVFHAVVMRRNVPALDDEGKQIAAAIATAVAGAGTTQEFEEKARAVVPAARAGVKDLRIEPVTPFIADGRHTEGPPGSFVDKDFAAAAFRIAAIGGVSPVVDSKFGFHVIQLLERLPGHVVPPAQRLELFAEPIFTERAREAHAAFLVAARRRVRVEQSSAAETLMADVGRALGPAAD